jgi:tryptophanyl-tRNA synthetase
VLAILKRGTERASAVAAQTMSEVNAALGLNYFG